VPSYIVPRFNAEPGYYPNSSEIESGEIVTNTGDGRIFLKTDSGIIVEFQPASTIERGIERGGLIFSLLWG
jgi:hypothetical protein